MTIFTICSIIIALSALFGFINTRFLKLPNTIGLMIIAIAFTLVLFASRIFTDYFYDGAQLLITQIDFREVLLNVMLGFLLFAGAIHTNFDQLKIQRWPVLVFSTVGVLISTFLIGAFTFWGFRALGLDVAFIHCLLFGALISPTDPIAVLGILKQAQVPKKLETKIVGESLFNDGVGVVVFMTIFSIASGGHHPGEAEADHGTAVVAAASNHHEQADHADEQTSKEIAKPKHADAAEQSVGDMIWQIAKLFGTEVLGGILLGAVFGTITFLLLRTIDDFEIEVMLTLACVMGGYALATYLHWSAPLATVVAGLIVGNDTARGTSMSSQTEMYVDKFWELVDILLNAVLFVLIGLELLILDFNQTYLWAGLLAIGWVLFARFLSLIFPILFFRKRLDFVPHTLTIMTWGGLRGGISIALALSLTTEMHYGLFLTVTYIVVIFSIIVQGLTVGGLAKKLIGSEAV